MQVSVEKTSELNRKMTVNIPETLIADKVAARLKKLTREAKVDGFRPGKVPESIIKQKFLGVVREEVTTELVQSTYPEALKTQNLHPVGHPEIQALQPEANGFSYVAEFEVYPEVVVTPFNSLSITRLVAEVTDADLEAMLHKLRVQQKAWELVERPAAHGDRVTFNFSAKLEDDEQKLSDYVVEIGAGKMVSGFEDHLVGLSAAEHKAFELTYPEDYSDKKFAGKTVHFEVDILSVEEGILPDIDAEFVKAYGIDSGDIDAFTADVRANMERELDRVLQDKLRDAVMEALYTSNQVPVPNALLQDEMRRLLASVFENAKRYNLNLTDLKLEKETIEAQARRRSVLGLILSQIIQEHAIKVDPKEVRANIEAMAQSYEEPDKVVQWYYEDKSRLVDIEQLVLEFQVTRMIAEQASITDESVSFASIMAPKAA